MNWERRGISFETKVFDKLLKTKPQNMSLSKYVGLLLEEQLAVNSLDVFFLGEKQEMPKISDDIEFWEDWADSQDKDVVLSVFKKTHCISGVMGGKICT